MADEMKMEQLSYHNTEMLIKDDTMSLFTKRFIESKYKRIPICPKQPCK